MPKYDWIRKRKHISLEPLKRKIPKRSRSQESELCKKVVVEKKLLYLGSSVLTQLSMCWLTLPAAFCSPYSRSRLNALSEKGKRTGHSCPNEDLLPTMWGLEPSHFTPGCSITTLWWFVFISTGHILIFSIYHKISVCQITWSKPLSVTASCQPWCHLGLNHKILKYLFPECFH